MKICVIGLGYVGLPLAVAFSRQEGTVVVGFDVNARLVRDLNHGIDPAGEVEPDPDAVIFTTEPEALWNSDVFIVAVPTPIDETKRPDLSALQAASQCVGQALRESRGALVVYESTVYPGCTEDLCLPILEEASGLKADQDFDVAYSPERVVPGDAMHSLERVTKLVAARNPKVLDFVATLYQGITKVHKVSSIRAAEAAKVLENTQRDLNIALMNECALIFERAGIDTNEVIDAAATKWNFHPYRPGLVGGHCIGVDPYYLTYMAERLGYRPEVILAGRRVNDSMGEYVAEQTVRALNKKGIASKNARVAVLGLTFKENVRDLRNSRVFDLVQSLESYGCLVILHDAHAGDGDEVEKIYGRPAASSVTDLGNLDAIVVATPHDAYKDLDFGDTLVLDVKGLYGDRYWRL